MPRTKPSADIAAFLKKMPASLKVAIDIQCDGDWRRVTLDGKSLTVHNQPQTTARARTPAPGTDTAQPATARRLQLVAPVEPEPEPEPTLEVEPAAPAPAPARARKAKAPEPVCERCGRAGHYTEDCRQPLLRARRPQPLPEPEPLAEPAPATTAVVAPAPASAPAAEVERPYWDRMEQRREQERREADKARKQPAKKAKLRTTVELSALAQLIGSEAPQSPAGVNIIKLTEGERRERLTQQLDVIPALVPYPEGDQDDPLTPSCMALLQRCKDGLPGHLTATVKPDVEALYGVDKQGIEDALRHPQRVTVRPESYQRDKRYPVLAFFRGDIEVILGMRFPNSPAVIAAYMGARLMHDTHRVNHAGGGGRKREDSGTPKTPGQVANRLRQLGAEVADPDVLNPKPMRVLYQGQDLGAISGEGTRQVCESDYQRMQRKIHAIKRRGASVG